jgi:hypothetical protein
VPEDRSYHPSNEEDDIMPENLIKKVQRGYQVDGLDLLAGYCGCGCLNGSNGDEVGECCHTYSSVKQENNTVAFFAKATTPHTTDNYEWGYRVQKGPVEVDVLVMDTRGPKNFPFRGAYPPALSEWLARGWTVLDQFERPLPGSLRKSAVLYLAPAVLLAAPD